MPLSDINNIILNTISHVAALVFIGVQYREYRSRRELMGFIGMLLLLLTAPEFLELHGPWGIVRVLFQALFLVTVSILIIREFDKRILVICFSGAVFSTPGNIIGNIMFLYIPDTVAYYVRLPLVLLVCIAIHALMLVIAITYVGKRMKKLYTDNQFPWIALFLVPAAYYCSIYTLRVWPQNFGDNPLNMVSAVFVSLLCIASYYLALKTMDYQKDYSTLYYNNQEYEIMIEQMMTRVTILNQKEKDLAIIRHNERHMVNLLHQLIEDEEYDMAISILDTHLAGVEATKVGTYCKNVVINSVLEAAQKECERRNIPINIQADIPEKLPVKDMELAMVVANLLENATLATERCKTNRQVNFLALKKGDKIIFEVTNTFIGKINYDQQNHIPLSSKGEGHGLGMQSVIMFAEKNNAVFDCSDKDGIFIVRLLLQDADEVKTEYKIHSEEPIEELPDILT
ncbi:MAG: GHKL domain-containing protein [Lachnospiraceae bacterium]|nr:GHKL domain-containing protein [Lachnospiraceae bacterium]